MRCQKTFAILLSRQQRNRFSRLGSQPNKIEASGIFAFSWWPSTVKRTNDFPLLGFCADRTEHLHILLFIQWCRIAVSQMTAVYFGSLRKCLRRTCQHPQDHTQPLRTWAAYSHGPLQNVREKHWNKLSCTSHKQVYSSIKWDPKWSAIALELCSSGGETVLSHHTSRDNVQSAHTRS